MTPPVVLTVAGSDSGGGAGVQADLKTFAALRTYGTSVITAVTAQNTRAVMDVYPMPGNVVAVQLNAVIEDFSLRATKVGMLASADIAGAVAAKARAGALPNLVVDPVLESSTGRRLGVVNAIERLLRYATVITPNREEASALVGWQVATPADMAGAAGQLAAGGPKYVVVTGGDLAIGDEAVDAVWTEAGRALTGARDWKIGAGHGPVDHFGWGA
jgi:hydroxymethylpyrimidine/phosphomethylpyrimidine kinase